ncbi:MAG: ACP synthase [Isosphaera sp.]|nr:ACP synthase [Isosphaera sp.]
MEIVGLGSQVMDCARVRKLIDAHGEAFLRQVYTDREVRYCNGKKQTTEQFAAVWAGKEAVFRALGTTWRRGMSWTDVEVVCDTGGPPRVLVGGPTRELMAARGATQVLLTLAFCREFATATGIAVRGSSPRPLEDTALDD